MTEQTASIEPEIVPEAPAPAAPGTHKRSATSAPPPKPLAEAAPVAAVTVAPPGQPRPPVGFGGRTDGAVGMDLGLAPSGLSSPQHGDYNAPDCARIPVVDGELDEAYTPHIVDAPPDNSISGRNRVAVEQRLEQLETELTRLQEEKDPAKQNPHRAQMLHAEIQILKRQIGRE